MFQKMKRRQREQPYDFTEHANERVNSRCLTEEMVNRALKYGKRKHQGGRILVFYQGIKVVLSGDGSTVITAYRRGTSG